MNTQGWAVVAVVTFLGVIVGAFAGVGWAIAVFVGGLIYMAPTLVAAGDNHANTSAILVLNLLLGWLLVPWVIALVWANTRNRTAELLAQQQLQAAAAPASSTADELAKLQALHAGGVLNADEFAAAKKRLLERT